MTQTRSRTASIDNTILEEISDKLFSWWQIYYSPGVYPKLGKQSSVFSMNLYQMNQKWMWFCKTNDRKHV